ncbi:hypothetical protein HZB89_01580 [archaeon]|nr:hypothetical protein [archaeon]
MTSVINAYFTPYRLSAAKKEPVQLTVEVTNGNEVEKLMSLEVVSSPQLSLSRDGFQNKIIEKMGELKPNEKRVYYYHVWLRGLGREDSQPLVVRVLEHHLNYDYITSKAVKRLELRVSRQ